MKLRKIAEEEKQTLQERVLLAVVVWTVLVSISLALQWTHEKKTTIQLVRNEALVTFHKDQAFRFWATRHGGVYVPITEATPPNSNLAHLEERDLTTPSGRRLTLMNPAYIIRQVMDDFAGLYGTKGRITSLKPFNPANTPDAWEEAALKSFEQGVEEVFEVVRIKGEEYLRLMRPMIVEAGCLKCHAVQGYKAGDVRGGVGVSVPMRHYRKIEAGLLRNMLVAHGGFWSMGILAILFVYGRERKRVQQLQKDELTLWELLKRQEALLSAIPANVYYKDSNLSYILVNKAFADMVGVAPEKVAGKNDYDFFPSAEAARYREQDRLVMESGQSIVSQEEPCVGADGADGWSAVTKVPYRGSSGEIVGMVGLSLDITHRKQAEEVLRQSHEELERKIEQRTRQLQEKHAQLVHTGRLAALGELAAGIAHELGQPLQVIKSVARIINDEQADVEGGAQLLPMIEKIFTQVDRASAILGDMRSFARYEHSGVLSVIDLKQPAEQALSFFREQFRQHGISLAVHFEENLPKVKADAQKFQQIVVNLLANARYAVDHQEVSEPDRPVREVRIRFYQRQEAGQVVVEVSDSGKGMSEEEKERCLEPFFTTKGVGEGTGLGLSILYGIVQEFQGEVEIDSAPGQGCVFRVVLPVITDF